MEHPKNLIFRYEINRWWLRLTLSQSVKMHTKDRNILEQRIFKDLYINPKIKKILFVGCHLYSSWYHKIFNLSGKKFHTVDSSPDSKIYGSPQKHFTERFELLSNKQELRNKYDCLILNGVFGYGIDEKEDKSKSVDTAYKLLKVGGILVIGFRDMNNPDIDKKTISLNLFEPTSVPSFKSHLVITEHKNNHVFICFKKK